MKKKFIIIFLIILTICTLGVIIVLSNMRKSNVVDEETKVEELDIISGYDYHLEDRDTELYKNKFNELKELLDSEIIDYGKYAEIISELYIIDLYTINNKTTKYDVGGLEFVYPDSKDNFETKVMDTLYKYVEDNSNGKRTQKLPEVKTVSIEKIEEETFEIKDITYSGFKINILWDYVEDLGYDIKSEIHTIRIEDKMYIIEQK